VSRFSSTSFGASALRYVHVPTYVPGERLTALRRWRPIRPGDVVVVRDPAISHGGSLSVVSRSSITVDLRGDNSAASTDSREFGLVESRDVSYIVLGPLPPVEAL